MVAREEGIRVLKHSVDECRLIDLPKITDISGSLTFIENSRHVPFDVKRIYYLYDIPGGSTRGAHAHRELHQFFIAMSGSFDIQLDDGNKKKTFRLNRSYYGLYVCPMMWRNLIDFSSGAVCMVLASEYYDEGEYIRDYDCFMTIAGRLE